MRLSRYAVLFISAILTSILSWWLLLLAPVLQKQVSNRFSLYVHDVLAVMYIYLMHFFQASSANSGLNAMPSFAWQRQSDVT